MIDTRLFAYIVLTFVGVLIYQAWIQDYGPKPAVDGIAETQPAMTDIPAPASRADVPDAEAAIQPAEHSPGTSTATTASTLAQAITSTARQLINVKTDVLALSIDLAGATVVSSELLAYPVDLQHPQQPVRIFSHDENFFVAQSGLIAGSAPAPDHYASYQAEHDSYVLEEGSDELRVPLSWSQDGISVTKTYIFRRGAYDIRVEQQLDNHSNAVWTGAQYQQLQRNYHKQSKNRFVNTYTGGVIYSPENKYEKISFDDIQKKKLNRSFSDGWAAMIQHYFLAAWIPPAKEKYRYYSNGVSVADGERYVLGMNGPRVDVPPGGQTVFSSALFVGPKIQDHLDAVAPGLELTVDYGFLTIIAQPLFIMLGWLHRAVHNWGWAIVLLTLMIKLVFYKLAETSYRSMANMRKVQPKMMAIRERYADDRQRQSQAMMEMYKKEKINPLGGCLPMVIQIPVFMALYWVLLESVELRQADFILWIRDLSVKDPYFVLPVIMGITMYVQQKLNPAPLDPVQAKVFMIMPFAFTVMFAFFPSGLVLYWVVNNTLTIAQQWFITRRVLKDN